MNNLVLAVVRDNFIVEIVNQFQYMTMQEIRFRVGLWYIGKGLEWSYHDERSLTLAINGLINKKQINMEQVTLAEREFKMIYSNEWAEK